MQFSVLIFSLVTIAQKTASQHADEWHFSWNESKEWNALRETKIFENTRMFDTREAGGQNLALDRGGTEGSNLIGGLPVYVSLTTISKRLHLLGPTIQSIIVGSVVPSMIYIFISTDPHLIDTGICEDDFMDEQTRLVDLLHFFHNIKFVFTENIGPHRKVLPLLYHKWDEDCVIISVDDDHIYSHHWLRDMLAYYVHSKGQAIISTRARRIAICSGQAPFHVAPYMHAIGTAYHTQWYEAAPHVHEMLLLPTGVGGVLYRPRFFNHSVAFNRELYALTMTADDLTFRLATLANGIPVYTACVHGDYKDHRRITHCPPLVDVGFQHIARRRTSSEDGNVEPEAMGHTALSVNDSGGVKRTVVERAEGVEKEESFIKDREADENGHEHLRQRLTSHRHSVYRPKLKRTGKHHDDSITWMRHLDNHDSTNATISSVGAADKGNNFQEHHSGGSVPQTAGSAENGAHVDWSSIDEDVYNRSQMLKSNMKVPTKNINHGKDGSLSSINRQHDGNFHQWNKATELLRRKGLFDIDVFIQQYVGRERRSCVVTDLLLNYDNSTWTGNFLGAFATQWQVLHENYWSRDSRCGVVACQG